MTYNYSVNNRSYRDEFEKKLDQKIHWLKVFCETIKDKKKRKGKTAP